MTNTVYAVDLYATVSGDIKQLGYSYIDPYVILDPGFLANNPGFSIVADPGYLIPSASVPDAALTLTLLGGTLAGLAALRRRFAA